MTHVQICPLKGDEALILAPKLRPADREEVRAASGRTPLAALAFAVEHSVDAHALHVNGHVAALLGLGLMPCDGTTEPIGVPWFLGSRDVYQLSHRQWLYFGHSQLERWFVWVSLMRNFVHANNRDSCRWLKHLGFTLLPPQPFGAKGALFHRFELSKQDFFNPFSVKKGGRR